RCLTRLGRQPVPTRRSSDLVNTSGASLVLLSAGILTPSKEERACLRTGPVPTLTGPSSAVPRPNRIAHAAAPTLRRPKPIPEATPPPCKHHPPTAGKTPIGSWSTDS